MTDSIQSCPPFHSSPVHCRRRSYCEECRAVKRLWLLPGRVFHRWWHKPGSVQIYSVFTHTQSSPHVHVYTHHVYTKLYTQWHRRSQDVVLGVALGALPFPCPLLHTHLETQNAHQIRAVWSQSDQQTSCSLWNMITKQTSHKLTQEETTGCIFIYDYN